MADNNQSIDNSDGTNGTDQQIISTPTTSTADILPPPDPTIATITSTTTTFTTTVANPSTSNGTIPKHSISSPMHYAQFQPPMYTNPYYHPFNQPFPNQPNPLHVNPPNPLIFQPNPNPNMQPPASMHAPLPNVQYANQPNLVYQSNVTNNAYPQSSTAQPPHTSNAQPSYQGNTAPQRPTGVNIERLFYHRTNIPLLVGYVNDEWEGITVAQWLSMVNDFFLEEKIYNDAEKLVAYQRFVDPRSTAFNIIQNTPELKHATTWQAFSTGLLNVLNPLTTVSSFEYWSQYRHIQWEPNSVLQVYCSKIQKLLDDFENSTDHYFGARFDPKMKRIIIFATIYDCVPPEHRHKVVQFFNANLEYPEQIREYMSKTGRVLENPFKNSKNKPSFKSARESTVSTVQSYSQATRKPASQPKAYKDRQTQIDPNTTPKCFRCERYGHYTDKCVFKTFCSSCREYHQRGTQPQCANTTWNFRSPEALQRVQYISKNKPNNRNNASNQTGQQNRRSNSKFRGNQSQPQFRAFQGQPNNSQSPPTRQNRSNSVQRNTRTFRPSNQVHYMQENIPVENLRISSEATPENLEYYSAPQNENNQAIQPVRPNSPYPYVEQLPEQNF